ncbi:hypothetical protein [Lysinibacillus sp. CTST325]
MFYVAKAKRQLQMFYVAKAKRQVQLCRGINDSEMEMVVNEHNQTAPEIVCYR